MFRRFSNITHTAATPADVINETEKAKAMKVIRKQLIIGAAALTGIVAASLVVAKVLDVDDVIETAENI